MDVSKVAGIFRLLIYTVLLISQPVLAGPSTPPAEPMAQIRQTVDEILALMRDPTLAAPEMREERRRRIMAEVDGRFDFREMSIRTLGRAWKDRNSAEQALFVDLFSTLLKNNYIGRVEAYSDEEINYRRVVFAKDGRRAMVFTSIVKSPREISINYKLVNRDKNWLVYDVVIEGVSLVKNYHSEFARIIRKEEYPGLIRRMQEKVKAN